MMSRKEKVRATKRKPHARKPRKPQQRPQKRQSPVAQTAMAMSIDQWAASINVGRDVFYDLQKRGEAPEVITIGRRKLITLESAARWLRKQEAAVAANA
jgi:hypothetical protein